jgi:hypothetical protein
MSVLLSGVIHYVPLTGVAWTASEQDLVSIYYELRSTGWRFFNFGRVLRIWAPFLGAFFLIPYSKTEI